MTERVRFVILSLPRTGSTYLVDYLDAVPGIRSLSEVFNRDTVLLRHHEPDDKTLLDKERRDKDPMGFLARLEQDVGACDFFGVKVFPGHSERLLRYFATSRQWKKIFLWRDNILEQYISFLLASAQYGSASWERVASEARLTLPIGALIDDLHAIEKSYIEVEDALVLADPHDVFTLEYDDMASDEVMEQLLRFLGVGDGGIAAMTPLRSGKLKFDRGPRAGDRIANYDEVRATLLRTRFARLVA
jgi:hypothetical protein